MALRNPCFKRPKVVSFGREKEKREGEGEEEEKKKKKGGSSSKAPLRYGNYFEYGFPLWNLKVCMNFHAIG